MTALTIVIQTLHILAGITWLGGQVFLYAALWPALLARPAGEARATVMEIAPRVQRLMRFVAPTLVLTGLVRGTVLGPIRTWSMLATPYGITFVVAFAIVAALSIHGGRTRTRVGPRVFGDGAFPDGARAFLRGQSIITLGGLGIVLVCMVLMRFSL